MNKTTRVHTKESPWKRLSFDVCKCILNRKYAYTRRCGVSPVSPQDLQVIVALNSVYSYTLSLQDPCVSSDFGLKMRSRRFYTPTRPPHLASARPPHPAPARTRARAHAHTRTSWLHPELHPELHHWKHPTRESYTHAWR